jgi:hypothetical protein
MFSVLIVDQSKELVDIFRLLGNLVNAGEPAQPSPVELKSRVTGRCLESEIAKSGLNRFGLPRSLKPFNLDGRIEEYCPY